MLECAFIMLLAVSAGTENPHPSCGTWSKAGLSKPSRQSLVEMLQDLKLSDRHELFFMQLPDCMPGSVSAQSTESLLGSPTADRRTGYLHGQVSTSELFFCKNSGTKKYGA